MAFFKDRNFSRKLKQLVNVLQFSSKNCDNYLILQFSNSMIKNDLVHIYIEAPCAFFIKGNWTFKQKTIVKGFPGGAVVENLPANAGNTGSSPGLGRSHMPRSN